MTTIMLATVYGSSLLDPKVGGKLHDDIATALSHGDDIILDFSGVGAVISAFFNPAVGSLYREFRAEELAAKLKVVNASPVHRKVLSEVIENAKRHVYDSAYEKAEQDAVDRMLNQ